MAKKQRITSDDENEAPNAGPSAAERGLTIETFQDRGFGSGGKAEEYAAKINKLMNAWKLTKDRIELNLEQLLEVGVVLYEAGLIEKDFDAVDAAFKSNLDELAVIKLKQEVLQGVYNKIKDDEETTYESLAYLETCERREEAYRKLAPRAKYSKSAAYKKFRERVWETEHAPEPMPPLSTLIPKVKSEPGAEGEEESDSDDELEAGGATQNFKDPLTYTTLKEPYTSTVCPHSFSKSAIFEYLAAGKEGRQECPNAGCKAILSRACLKEDKELGKRVAAFERREERLREERDREGRAGEEVLSDEDE